MTTDWRAQLDDLRAGPYTGYGGLRALAQALGVTVLTVKNWRSGRNEPSWANRQKIARLHARHEGGQTVVHPSPTLPAGLGGDRGDHPI